jgi:hypothetical protein
MTRFLGCLFLAAAMTPALAADNDAKDDPSAWTPIKIPGRQPAPEFADVTDWINSRPLKIGYLKGKVVVVHFMAFG